MQRRSVHRFKLTLRLPPHGRRRSLAMELLRDTMPQGLASNDFSSWVQILVYGDGSCCYVEQHGDAVHEESTADRFNSAKQLQYIKNDDGKKTVFHHHHLSLFFRSFPINISHLRKYLSKCMWGLSVSSKPITTFSLCSLS